MVQKITVEQFLEMSRRYPMLDVRSPGEFLHAHIRGANSLPLFTDEERKVVGTAYKQQSRQTAIKEGLDYFGVKMRKMVEQVEGILADRLTVSGAVQSSDPSFSATGGTVLVHCWRGGMRSAGVAWLLDLYGFKVYTLTGGYKAYRKWVREQFEKSYQLIVLGGYTGSGKTEVLHELQKEALPIIDLEGIAHHKGSAFGALGESKQPTQEMFENLLAQALDDFIRTSGGFAFIEDESQRIGLLKLPDAFWKTMRNSTICFLDIPFEERLDYISREYGKFEKAELVNAIMRIQKRLGGMETKTAISYLVENNYKECFRVLLKYYDKWYHKGLFNREHINEILHTISVEKIDRNANSGLLLNVAKNIQAAPLSK